MKKLITLFICSLFIVNCDSNSVEMANYEKNVATAKKFYKSFSDKKLRSDIWLLFLLTCLYSDCRSNLSSA